MMFISWDAWEQLDDRMNLQLAWNTEIAYNPHICNWVESGPFDDVISAYLGV